MFVYLFLRNLTLFSNQKISGLCFSKFLVANSAINSFSQA